MATLEGNVTLDGAAVEGAVVRIINTSDNSVTVQTTDSNGYYSADVPGGNTYHVTVEYDDGTDYHTSESKPFVDVGTTTSVIDDFESGNLGSYSGAGNFQTVSTPTQSGSFALEGDGWAANRIYSDSGLDNYPSKPEQFEFYIRSSNVADAWQKQFLEFARQDADNSYEFGINWQTTDQYIQIRSWSGGSQVAGQTVAFTDFTPAQDTWYRVEITWDDGNTYGGSDGDITLTIDDADSTASHTASINDTNYSGGGIAWETDGANPVYFDECTLL